MNIGIIGAGAIATYLLEEQNNYDYTVTSIFVRNQAKYERLEQQFNVTLYTDIEAFLQSSIDVVVEAANIEAVTEFLPRTIAKKDTIVISIGALTDEVFIKHVKKIADHNHTFIYLPSGAIGGLDLIQNVATVGKINEVTLETRKPAHTLINEQITEDMIIFQGTAVNAIQLFPKNINVSIAISLAGVGLERTIVRIIADPLTKKNTHKIFVSGEFGEATFQVENKALPTNPKTSYLAAMSVIGTLDRINNRIKIGS